MIKTGDMLDEKYWIRNLIGQGGMSRVYLAENKTADAVWAIKEVQKKGYINQWVVIQSLITEKDILKELRQHGIVSVSDVLETNVGTLLGGAIMDEVNKDTVAEQLAKISEQLAIKNRRSKRIWKIVGIVLLTILALNLLLAIFGMSAYTSFSTDGKTTVIEMNEDSVSYEE